MEKKIIIIDDLILLEKVVENPKERNLYRNLYNLLSNNGKYMTKKIKQELESIGFEYKCEYVYKINDRVFETKSGQIDIIDNHLLRVGIGRIEKFNPSWYEIDLDKIRE